MHIALLKHKKTICTLVVSLFCRLKCNNDVALSYDIAIIYRFLKVV